MRSRAGADTSPLLSRNVERFQGGLVCKAHRLLYNSTLGSRVINKKQKKSPPRDDVGAIAGADTSRLLEAGRVLLLDLLHR